MSKLDITPEELRELFVSKRIRPRRGWTGLSVKDKTLVCTSGCAIGAILAGTPWESDDCKFEPTKLDDVFNDPYIHFATKLGVDIDGLRAFWSKFDSDDSDYWNAVKDLA